MMPPKSLPHARNLNFLSTLFILLGFLLGPFPRAHADQPHYYMLLEEGNEKFFTRSYTGEIDFHYIITEVSDGISHQQETIFFMGSPSVSTRYFHMTEGGDVWQLPTLDAPPENWRMVLDMPLTPGKTWGRSWGEFGENYTRYTVGAPIMAYTIFGDLMGIPVHFQTEFDGNFEEGRYLYVDGYGLVHWGYSCFACEWSLTDAVIDVDKTTWGSLKAIYR